jgi:hypothetical protein
VKSRILTPSSALPSCPHGFFEILGAAAFEVAFDAAFGAALGVALLTTLSAGFFATTFGAGFFADFAADLEILLFAGFAAALALPLAGAFFAIFFAMFVLCWLARRPDRSDAQWRDFLSTICCQIVEGRSLHSASLRSAPVETTDGFPTSSSACSAD